MLLSPFRGQSSKKILSALTPNGSSYWRISAPASKRCNACLSESMIAASSLRGISNCWVVPSAKRALMTATWLTGLTAVSQPTALFGLSARGGLPAATRPLWILPRAVSSAAASRPASSYVKRIWRGPALVSTSMKPPLPSGSESLRCPLVITSSFMPACQASYGPRRRKIRAHMRRALSFLVLCFALGAAAQPYPAKPVRIIVPAPPGGGYDFIGRLLAESFNAQFGQGFIVENRTGAGTLVGTQAASSAAPDGYALLIGGLAQMAFNPALFKSPGYDPVADFTPVALVGAFTYALVARKDLPQSTLGDVINFARQNPGKLT